MHPHRHQPHSCRTNQRCIHLLAQGHIHGGDDARSLQHAIGIAVNEALRMILRANYRFYVPYHTPLYATDFAHKHTLRGI